MRMYALLSLDRGNLLLPLGNALGNEGTAATSTLTQHNSILLDEYVLVLGLLLLLALNPAALERAEVTAALETDRGDQSLDLGSKGRVRSARR
jgi:hypothetical protein